VSRGGRRLTTVVDQGGDHDVDQLAALITTSLVTEAANR